MNETSIKKLIAKVHTWQSIPLKERRKIARAFVADEAAIGTQKEQTAYRNAVAKEDKAALKKLNKQAEARRKKTLKWLSDNGY
jgi:phage-related minor tail protein